MSKSSKELEIILQDQDVNRQSMQQLVDAFGAPFTEAGEILLTYKDIKVTAEDQHELMQAAREKRLALKRIRTGVEAKRKELKEDALKAGRAIDSVARYIRENIKPAEEYLELQEKFAELKKRAEMEAKRAERVQALLELGAEVEAYNLDKMTDGMFAEIIKDLQKRRDQELAEQAAREEAERKEEQARLAERAAREKAEREAEQARLAEQERVSKIATEIAGYSHSILTIEDAKSAASKLEGYYAALSESDKKTDRISAAYYKSRADIIEAMQYLVKQQERAEAERVAREEAEAKAKAEEAERQALLAPDKDKLRALALDVRRLLDAISLDVQSDAAKQIVHHTKSELFKLQKTIEREAEGL